MTEPGRRSARCLDELRRRRAELQALDDAVSYVRRVAQGRADLARDALSRASDDSDPTPVYARATCTTSCATCSPTDCSATRPGRPGRPRTSASTRCAVELDQLCARHGFGRLDRARRPASSERWSPRSTASSSGSRRERKAVFAELDDLTEELVRRYRRTGPGRSQGQRPGRRVTSAGA